jgi:hypothetical protein
MPVSPEAELHGSFQERAIEIIPTGAALGAEIRGVDLTRLDDASFSRITRAWLDHSVILIRDQTLDDAGLVAFSRRFGDLDWAPIQETGRRFVEGMPEIYVVSNVLLNGEPIGSLGAGEAVWHTDMSYLELPPKASMLYALEVPPSGGNTSFCSMYAVYDGLPPSLKRRIAAEDQARRHLQQRRLCPAGSDADRRSADLARRGSPAGLRPSGERAAHALPRQAPQCVHRRARPCGIRGAAGRTVVLRVAPGVRVGACMAGRRPGVVGQSLHDAPARSVRCRLPAHPAPDPDQGRAAAGLIELDARLARREADGGMCGGTDVRATGRL